MPDWDIMLEQMLVYFVFTYFCGAVYDGRIQAKNAGVRVQCLYNRRNLARQMAGK